MAINKSKLKTFSEWRISMSKVFMGFEFQNEEEYITAKKELEYINKINGNIKTAKPEQLLEIYNKIVNDKMFRTPVGMEYLRNIQISLVKNKQIDKNMIQSIPAIVYNSGIKSVKEDKRFIKYKDLYTKMIIVNVALVLIIIVMFVISHNSKKFDEDYYRESIENEYIDWEQSIKERESIVKEKENNQ